MAKPKKQAKPKKRRAAASGKRRPGPPDRGPGQGKRSGPGERSEKGERPGKGKRSGKGAVRRDDPRRPGAPGFDRASEIEEEIDEDERRHAAGDGVPSWIRELRQQRLEQEAEEEAQERKEAARQRREGRQARGDRSPRPRFSRGKRDGAHSTSRPGASPPEAEIESAPGAKAGKGAAEGKSTPGPRRERIDRSDKPIDQLLDRLHHARLPLFREHRAVMKKLKESPGQPEPHRFCTREFNQMRISDLEAMSIARAFRREPHLIHRLAEVQARVEEELKHLKRSRKRQNFTCPLLDGERCLVHQAAKPIGCLSFNGSSPSEAGWKALNTRNRLNDRLVDRSWELQAIPLMLAKYLDGESLEKVKVALKTSDAKATRRGLQAARKGQSGTSDRPRKNEGGRRGRNRGKKSSRRRPAGRGRVR